MLTAGCAQKQAQRAAVEAANEDTVQAVVERFIERYAKVKQRDWVETEKMLQREVVSRWGKLRFAVLPANL